VGSHRLPAGPPGRPGRHGGGPVGALPRLRPGPDRGRVSGNPEQVADEIERWLDEVGIDGINLLQYHSHDTARDFVELVAPVLRERGRLRREYDERETLRDRIFGEGDRLPERHYATRYRGGSHLPAPIQKEAQR
jgi:hypothetical protein